MNNIKVIKSDKGFVFINKETKRLIGPAILVKTDADINKYEQVKLSDLKKNK